MNASFLSCALVLFATTSAVAQQSIYIPLKDPSIVFRGQSGTYEDIPDSGAAGNGFDVSPNQFGNGTPPSGTFTPPALGQDPFLPGNNEAPYASPVGQGSGGGQFSFGANGPQPYRFGWTQRYDAGYIFGESVSGNPGVSGDFSVTEFEADWEHTTPLNNGWIFSFTQEFDMRLWEGPQTAVGTPVLPGQVFRLGWDLELATALPGPWNLQVAFNPSINTDFKRGITSDAFNLDGRAILFYRASPQWMWAGGVGYWDRVKDRIVPYAGAIWTPNDIWEFRLMFPKPRVSVFLGNIMGGATWAYVSGEYHVEAYEVSLDPIAAGSEQIELEDWRVMAGLRTDYGAFQGFIEGGWVFGRDVRYKNQIPGFNISDGAMLRAGLRF